jgi:hypothetical protein
LGKVQFRSRSIFAHGHSVVSVSFLENAILLLNCFFAFVKNQLIKQVQSRSLHQWERGRYKERVQEGEYDGNIIYSYMKMEK